MLTGLASRAFAAMAISSRVKSYRRNTRRNAPLAKAVACMASRTAKAAQRSCRSASPRLAAMDWVLGAVRDCIRVTISSQAIVERLSIAAIL